MLALTAPNLPRSQCRIDGGRRRGVADGMLEIGNRATGARIVAEAGDPARMRRCGEALEFGAIGVATGIISYEGAPFGGMKAPGVGREGPHRAIEEFTELKYLCIGDVNG